MADTKNKIAMVTSVLSGTSVALSMYRDAKKFYSDKFFYTAGVAEGSYVFDYLMLWLNGEINSRNVKFSSRQSGIRRMYNSEGVSHVTIEGYEFQVVLSKPELGTKGGSYDFEYGDGMKSELVFTTRRRAGLDALERFLEKLTKERKRDDKSISLYNLTSYGWESKSLNKRSIDSVFFPNGVKEELLDDISLFFNNEDRYNRMGIPWHRGYLFYGPPGNGKSSICSAIANHFRMDVYNMPLSGVKDDRQLAESIGRIGTGSILLLEDIDIFSRNISREQGDKGPTLAGLLNALDGVSTPHGLVTFMTTNHIENLDPALIRNGRIDCKLELLPPQIEQVEKMFEYSYNEPLGVEPREFTSMAELSEVFKKNFLDAEAARLEIKKES